MNRYRSILLAAMLAMLCTVLIGCSKRSAEPCEPASQSSQSYNVEELPLSVRIFFRPLPDRMPGSENDTPQMIALGKRLFFEQGVSLTKSQSCNDCHRLDKHQAGVDYLPTSKGAKGIAGTRNSPTVLNAGFQAVQFWDGRAHDVVEQAKGPLLNPVEMAMRSEEDVVKQLKETEGYADSFKSAFPNQAEPITFNNVALAIAAFERTLITPARFDRYLKGDITALNGAEIHGLHKFMDTGCSDCHSSITVGGRIMQKFGVHHPYKNQADLGRYGVTNKEEDKLVFKVGMLRNVTLTAPYFHDGQVATLPEAVKLMAWVQLDTALEPNEINEIICFLRTLEAEHPINID